MAVPADKPVTRPDVLMVATLGASELQAPSETASDNNELPASHSDSTPVMDGGVAGSGVTTSDEDADVLPHAFVTVYMIIVNPGDNPMTVPVVASADANAGLLLLHVPPGVASLKTDAVN